MNTIMKATDNGITVTDNDDILSSVINSFIFNNSFCPNIERVIHSLSKKRNEKSHRNDYTLATTIFFADGTKTTVKNSIHDKVNVVKKNIELSDGSVTEVETATTESKEVGIMYALVKRIVGGCDENGTVGKGFCTFLNRIAKEAYDQNVESVRNAGEEKIRKAKAKALKSKQKTEKPSLRKCVDDLTTLIANISKTLKTK